MVLPINFETSRSCSSIGHQINTQRNDSVRKKHEKTNRLLYSFSLVKTAINVNLMSGDRWRRNPGEEPTENQPSVATRWYHPSLWRYRSTNALLRKKDPPARARGAHWCHRRRHNQECLPDLHLWQVGKVKLNLISHGNKNFTVLIEMHISSFQLIVY